MADQLAGRARILPALDRDRVIAWVPALYPLSLIVGLLSLPAGNVALRLGLLVAVAPAVVFRPAIGPTYRRWFAVLGLYLATITLSALAASNSALAWADLQRQVFLIVVVVGLSLALANLRSRKAFAVASALVAITATALIWSLYGRFGGIPLIGPVQESFKAYASTTFDVPLNAVSFATVLAACLALPFIVRRPAAVILLAVPVLIAVAVSGSRTTVLSLAATIPITAALLLIRGLRIPFWVLVLSITVVASWAAIALGRELGAVVTSPALSEVTTGRSLLWSAAWSKFLEQPWFGWGGGSFTVELGRFMPPTEVYRAENLAILGTTGGAHNAFLTVLAERGVFAGLAAVLVVAFVVYVSLRLFQARNRLVGFDRAVAWLAPFLVVLIFIRSFGELPGWFGYADSINDFLAYGCVALIVAVAATLDGTGGPVGNSRPTLPAAG